MAERVVGQLAYHLEAVPAVEVGRLEAVRRQRKLAAAARLRFGFDGPQELRSAAAVAPVLAHPEALDPPRGAPCPALHAGQQ